MENKNEIIYKLVAKLPYPCLANLKIGTIIRYDRFLGYFIGDELYPFNAQMIKKYCVPCKTYEPQIRKEDFIFFREKTSKGTFILVKGKIVDFNVYDNLYKIEYKIHGAKLPYTKWLKYEDIIIPRKYYFLSSKGIVQDDYEHRDEEAEKWRKAVGNFFTAKEDCQAYRNKIIESFK